MHGAIVDVLNRTGSVTGWLAGIVDLRAGDRVALIVDEAEVAHVAGQPQADPVRFLQQSVLLIGRDLVLAGVTAWVGEQAGRETLDPFIRKGTAPADAVADAVIESPDAVA